jgi:hypothetical protein
MPSINHGFQMGLECTCLVGSLRFSHSVVYVHFVVSPRGGTFSQKTHLPLSFQPHHSMVCSAPQVGISRLRVGFAGLSGAQIPVKPNPSASANITLFDSCACPPSLGNIYLYWLLVAGRLVRSSIEVWPRPRK